MKKTSFSKKLVASACALTLAASMPVAAVAAEGDSAAGGTDAPAQLADAADPEVGIDVPEFNAGELTQTIETTSPKSEFNELTGGDATISATVTADASITDQSSATEAFTGEDAAAPIIEATTQVSEAYKNAEVPADDVIAEQSFKVTPSGSDATDSTTADVTVVYTVDKNAQNIEAVAYVTIRDAKGNIVQNMEPQTLAYTASTGEFAGLTIALKEGQTADVTIAISNTDTTAAVDPENNATTSPSHNGDVWDLKTATVQQFKGNGQLDWDAYATGSTEADDADAAIAKMALAPTATTAGNWDTEDSATKSQAVAGPFNLTVTTDPTVKNGTVTFNLPGYNGYKAVVYKQWTDAEGNPQYDTIELTVSNGKIEIPAADSGTYSVALFDTNAPTPDEPIIDPDQPSAPGQTGTTAPGKDNGAAAADEGATSPKTGF